MAAAARPERRELVWPLLWSAAGLALIWAGSGEFGGWLYVSLLVFPLTGGYPVLPFLAAMLALMQRRRGPLAVPLVFSGVGFMAIPVVLLFIGQGLVERLAGSSEAWRPVVMGSLLLACYIAWLGSAWRAAMPTNRRPPAQ